MAKPYKTGITFGVFDMFHIGHLNLIRNAKAQCDKLIVCVSDDMYCLSHKGRIPIIPHEQRKSIVGSISGVDVVSDQTIGFGKVEAVKRFKPDVIFVGSDWTPRTFEGERLGVPVVYLPHTDGISTSILREATAKDMTKEVLVDEAARFMSYFEDKFKLTTYLQFGTLLGAVRDHDIPDNDVKGWADFDICFLSSRDLPGDVRNETLEIYRELQKEGLLRRYWTQDKVIGKWQMPRESGIEENITGQAHVCCHEGCLNIDLFTSWLDQRNHYWTVQWGDFGGNEFFPCEQIEIRRRVFNIPGNSHKILEHLYEDWKRPMDDHPSNRLPRKCYFYD